MGNAAGTTFLYLNFPQFIIYFFKACFRSFGIYTLYRDKIGPCKPDFKALRLVSNTAFIRNTYIRNSRGYDSGVCCRLWANVQRWWTWRYVNNEWWVRICQLMPSILVFFENIELRFSPFGLKMHRHGDKLNVRSEGFYLALLNSASGYAPKCKCARPKVECIKWQILTFPRVVPSGL